jgi:titin
VVEGNYIGTDVFGSLALGNYAGVTIDGGINNVIGGTFPQDANVVSGNGYGVTLGAGMYNGVVVGSTGNVVQGNLIGTDASGTHTTDPNGHPLGNLIGVAVAESNGDIGNPTVTGNTIGGTGSGQGNVIAGNIGDGVLVLEQA